MSPGKLSGARSQAADTYTTSVAVIRPCAAETVAIGIAPIRLMNGYSLKPQKGTSVRSVSVNFPLSERSSQTKPLRRIVVSRCTPY